MSSLPDLPSTHSVVSLRVLFVGRQIPQRNRDKVALCDMAGWEHRAFAFPSFFFSETFLCSGIGHRQFRGRWRWNGGFLLRSLYALPGLGPARKYSLAHATLWLKNCHKWTPTPLCICNQRSLLSTDLHSAHKACAHTRRSQTVGRGALTIVVQLFSSPRLCHHSVARKCTARSSLSVSTLLQILN